MNLVPSLTITQADDWHIHLRDGAFLQRTVPDVSTYFKRALVMPNLKPPITTASQAQAYRERILSYVPAGRDFDPKMSLYLTDHTTVQDLKAAKQSGCVLACKLYPLGSTTHSEEGVSDQKRLYPLFEVMRELGLLLLIHGAVTDPEIDVFDRESVFIDRHLLALREQFPGLKIILEHLSTEEGVAFVSQSGPDTAGTITPQHLLLDRNHLLVGGIKPHHYCLPVLKRKQHQVALLKAATSGLPCFFLGTDSAPHSQTQKQSACGCAGIYTAPYALSYYARAFASVNALDRLEGFASFFGADFYGLARNTRKLKLSQQAVNIPPSLAFGDEAVIPLFAQETLDWQVSFE